MSEQPPYLTPFLDSWLAADAALREVNARIWRRVAAMSDEDVKAEAERLTVLIRRPLPDEGP